MHWPLGVVSVVYGDLPVREVARLAKQQGFDHLDVSAEAPDDLALPIGDRVQDVVFNPCDRWVGQRELGAGGNISRNSVRLHGLDNDRLAVTNGCQMYIRRVDVDRCRRRRGGLLCVRHGVNE